MTSKIASGKRTVVAGVAFIFVLASAPVFAQKSSTAQSAMFDNTASGTFLITGSEVWAYDRPAAAAYFTNLGDGNPPSVSCTGGGPGGVNCLEANRPATPAAAAPDATKLINHLSNNSCNFWAGTALTLDIGTGTTYTQDVSVRGVNGSGNWKFTFTYNIAFAETGAGPFPAMTAWTLQSSESAAADVTVAGFFAGQSTVKKTGGGSSWTFKVSHTMTNDDGTSRLVDPVAHILDSDANEVCTLLIDTALELGVDYFYSQNAGNNGPLSQLIDGASVNAIQNGSVSSPGADTDNFAGNNATLGERANVVSTTPPACSITAAGAYTLNVTGTLKGVVGSASLPVSVSSSVCISAESCSVCP